ncbi:sodium-dependent phosphate transporter 1-like isoform X2 [Dreissena polymorpha]|uniref:Phosphate transporter n=1 Tax=Dreissena polymorpha TaxID=45954 RepID=A0A9D4BX00_DREPO|nr:sodium-dependent phosphate transporter 1-like isoform X2 [Dreissena polymorpha]KAH3709863.1 hypothetical protein DPMN_069328 [Dreissena polymorpha]
MLGTDSWTVVNPEWMWIVVVGFIVAFALAFGIGANDVANSFGSSVGAKVLTLKQACILATIFEILGSVLIGAKVSDTIRKGIISVELFPNGTEPEFMVGNLAALSGSCIWMLVASLLKLPVSATHSIVGATLGFSLVIHGVAGVNWKQLGFIVGSWFASPVLSGAISTAIFFFLIKTVLSKAHPLEPGLMLLPLFYGITIAINFFSIFYNGSQLLHFDKIPLYGTFILTFGSAIIVAIVVRFLVVPWQRKKINNHVQFLLKQKEEEGLLESDKNYQESIQAHSKESQAYKAQLAGLHKGANLVPDFTSTPAKQRLPDGVDDTNVDEQILAASVVSLSSKTYSLASKAPLIMPEKKKHKKEKLGAIKDEVKDVIVANGEIVTKETNGNANVSGSSGSLSDEISVNSEDERRERARAEIHDTPECQSLFSFLQVLTAVFGSFAHGGNDVSNAIGPLVALWITATTGSAAQKAPVPIWILLLGGLGISVGLWVLGRRVMKTLGEDLTKITPSSGFCIEVGSALTVLIASNIGIPISTTHCKVGSIVFVGWFRSRAGVDWKLFRNIIIAWFVTLPIAGGLSAGFMAALRYAV